MKNAAESSTTPEANQPPTPERSERKPPAGPPKLTGTDQLREISRLMRGDEDDADDGEQGERDTDDPPPRNNKPRQVKSLVDAAKALGMEVEDLYALEVPLRVASGERKALKLSELKDYHDAQDDHRLERIAWEEERSREHADIARSRAELAELLAMVPEDKLKPDVLNKIRQRHDGLVAIERQKTLKRIPAWQDEDTRAADLAGIAEHLADYGFPAKALQGISDHRMLAYMRDNWLRKQRLTTALEKVKTVRSDSRSRSRPAAKPPGNESVRPSAGARTIDRQVAEVSKILRGSS